MEWWFLEHASWSRATADNGFRNGAFSGLKSHVLERVGNGRFRGESSLISLPLAKCFPLALQLPLRALVYEWDQGGVHGITSTMDGLNGMPGG